MENKENQNQTEEANIIRNMQVFSGAIPDLSKATPSPLPINGDYWTPREIGECRRMFFMDLRTEYVIDKQSGEEEEINVVYFVYPVNGRNTVVRQMGIQLTSIFANFVSAGTIKPGMAFEITYLGKKRTTTGNNMDSWSIVELKTE